jgi:hypothetical protein
MGSHIDDISAPTTAHSVINIRLNQKLVKLKLKKESNAVRRTDKIRNGLHWLRGKKE